MVVDRYKKLANFVSKTSLFPSFSSKSALLATYCQFLKFLVASVPSYKFLAWDDLEMNSSLMQHATASFASKSLLSIFCSFIKLFVALCLFRWAILLGYCSLQPDYPANNWRMYVFIALRCNLIVGVPHACNLPSQCNKCLSHPWSTIVQRDSAPYMQQHSLIRREWRGKNMARVTSPAMVSKKSCSEFFPF